jgi:hypothetical protein
LRPIARRNVFVFREALRYQAAMPRQKSLVTVIREMVQAEIRNAMAGLLSGLTAPKNARRRRTRGKWRPGGPGRPPKAVAARTAPRKK